MKIFFKGFWSIVIFLIWINFFRGQSFGEGYPVEIQMDCREGIGLIPSLWRGIRGNVPTGLKLRVVCLDSEPVRVAWASKIKGSGYDWRTLDTALALNQPGVDLVLPLPVPKEEAEARIWTELVTATVQHVSGRVSRFEIRPEGWDLPSIREGFLPFYESGVWAIYGVSREMEVGGSGISWDRIGIKRLISYCRDKTLPLHFVSWQMESKGPTDLARSISDVEGILDQYAMLDRPRLLVTGWHASSCSSNINKRSLGLSSLVSSLDLDVEAICLDLSRNEGTVDVLHALDRLGRVRLPMTIQSPNGNLEGIASKDGDKVLALFWNLSEDQVFPGTISIRGLPGGRKVRIQHFRIGSGTVGTEPIEDKVFPIRDPLNLEIIFEPWWVTLVKLELVGG